VCDTENVAIEPANPRIQAGASVQFTAFVVGENTQTVTWTLTGNLKPGTAISENGTLTVDPEEAAASVLIVSAASTVCEKSGSTIATVTHSPVVIAPQRGGYTETIAQGGQITFVAASVGHQNNAVDWELSGATKAGTSFSDSDRKLTVAVEEPVGTVLTLKAALSESEGDSLNEDGTRKRGALELRVVPAVSSVSVNEPEGGSSIVKGKNLSLSAKVNGVNSSEVVFTISPDSTTTTAYMSGTLYVPASESANTVKVRATSTVDETKYGEIDISILAAPQVTSVTVSPASPSVGQGGTRVFTAIVAGVGNVSQQVKWSITGGTGTTAIANNPGDIGEYTQHGATLSIASNQAIADGSITVTATAKDKDSDGDEVTGSTTVTVTAPAATVTSVTVSPAKANMPKGYTGSPFTKTVTGMNNPAQEVTWSLSGSSGASSIDTASGAITIGAEETNTALTVTATSTLDTSKYGTAAITVRANEWAAVSGYDTGAISSSTIVKAFASAVVDAATWYVFSGESGQVVKNNAGLSGGTWYRFTAANAATVIATDMASGTYNGTPTMVIAGTLGKMALSNSTTIAGTSTTASTAKWIAIAAGTTTAEKVSQFPSTEDISAIAYGNNTFIAVGNKGTISRSTDGGMNWNRPTTNPFTANYNIRSIAFAGSSTFYAVGEANSVENYVIKLVRSTDNGANWTELPSLQTAVGIGVGKVSFGGGKIIVAGAFGSGSVFTVVVSSDNGVTWSTATPGCFSPDRYLGSVAAMYDGTRFIISGGNLVNAYSADGLTWTRLFTAVSGADLIGPVKWDGANYVAGGTGKILKIPSLF
jgi:hypothetical protein